MTNNRVLSGIKLKLPRKMNRAFALGVFIGIATILFPPGFGLVGNHRSGSDAATVYASAQESADLNNDNRVDISDLSLLVSKWGTSDSAADLNQDGTVNIFDLSRLISRWGAVSGTTRAPGIYVSGNKLVNGQGDEVILHGVNKMGSEYACIGGWGFFDGPTDQASINVMKTWNINAVRITMNSVCWNNGPTNQFESYNAAYAGTNYKNAIKNYVDLLVQNGIHPILDLQWAGCGTGSCLANWIKVMPDRPGAVNFWSDVAATFKDNKAVLFDLYNEPQDPTWQCWRDGGCIAYQGTSQQYTMAGMQEMVSAVRAAGATTQPIMIGGRNYSNEVTGWLEYKPTDPNNSLVTSVHLYNFNWPCPNQISQSDMGTAADAITCFTSFNDIRPVMAAHPVVFGELGQNDCQTSFVTPMMDWMYTNKMSMLGWTWHPYDCASTPSLLANWDGTPSGLGAAFKTHYTTKYPTWTGIK